MVSSKKVFTLTIVLTSLILGLTGCNFFGDDKTVYEGEGNVKLVVDWEEFEGTELGINSQEDWSILQEEHNDITHVGARIEYPKYGGTWSQYVEKKTAESEGIITFRIPAAESVSLYVGAVYHTDVFKASLALWFGVIHDIEIPQDSIIEITMDDINWVEARWKLDDDNRMLVREPFHEHLDNISYSDSFVGIQGTASIHGNVDGWRIFTGEGEPFFKGDFFSLSTSIYMIPKKQ